MVQTTSSRGFTRRSFIKGVAAVTAAGALAGCTPKEDDKQQVDPAEVPETKLYSGVCRGNCMGGCPINVHVRDGLVVRTSAYDLPDPRYNRICPRGLTHPYRMYGAERILYPMKRIGERGSGEFERISWDEAIGTIVEKWKGYTAEFGPSAFAIYMCSGSYSLVNGMTDGNPFQRLINATGCTYINPVVDYASMGTIGMMPGNAGWCGSSNEQPDMVNASTLVVWGANPIVSQPNDVHWIMDAVEAGTKLVVIDPQYTNLVQKAHMHVPVRPATDGLLAIAMCKLMVERGWANEEFLLKYSSSPYLVKAADGMFLTTADLDPSIPAEEARNCVLQADGLIVAFDEAVDPVLEGSCMTDGGIEASTSYSLFLSRLDEYDMQTCLDTCGLTAELVEELTDLYANGGPAQIFCTQGVNHYTNGTSGFVGMYTVMILAGQIGGSGRGLARATNGSPIIDKYGASLSTNAELPQGAFGWFIYGGHGISILQMGDVMETHQYQGQEVNIKGLYITHANPLTSAADKNHVISWMDKIEFIAAADVNMNETMMYADVILPAAYWFEMEDVWTYAGGHPYAVFQEKAVEPLGECRVDFEIVKAIAEGLGVGQWFDMSGEEYFDSSLNELAADLGITYAALKEKKVMKQWYDTPSLFSEQGSFSGVFSLYRPFPYPMVNGGAAYDPQLYKMIYWEAPTEAGFDNPLRERFPYHLISDHSRFRTHSQWWDAEPLVEIDGEPKLKVSPKDAEALGLVEGDLAKIYNDRGFAVMPVAIHAGLQPGVIAAEKGWPKHQLRDGDFATLSGSFTNTFVNNSAFNDVLVAVEKVS